MTRDKLIHAEDILADARGFLRCTWMAATNLEEPEETDAIQTVASAASEKIEEAIALLDEYRAEISPRVNPVEGPVTPAAAARTRRNT